MAQVAEEKTRRRVEKLLSVGRTRWEWLSKVETEFGEWDPDDQEAFIVGWVVEDDRLRRLEQLSSQGAMTEEQSARYEKLKKLVTRNRPIIDRLADR